MAIATRIGPGREILDAAEKAPADKPNESPVLRTFYRGEHTNFYPDEASLERDDAVARYLLCGLVPAAPMIGPENVVVAFGSCFARFLADHLSAIGYNVPTKRDTTSYISIMDDGIVNTFAMRQQFEWAWQNRSPQVSLWHGFDGREYGYDEDVRLKTKSILDSADVFVLTLGLSEIWYDEPTGEVFWRAIPTARFDPTRHKFRLSTHAENLANLHAIYDLIRVHRPQATVVFTLSPIPLQATFRDIGCLVANAASKAVLRGALEEFIGHVRPNDSNVFYFPSYEIATTCYRRPNGPDRRHPHLHVIEFNLAAFERYFCHSSMTDADLLEIWKHSQSRDLQLAQMSPDEADRLYRAEREELGKRLRSERRQARQAQKTRRAPF